MDTKRLTPPPSIINSSQMISESVTAPHSPSSPTRKRKSKIVTQHKTNEEVILESHQQLMHYLQRIDDEVRKIVKTYEAQFLLAYRNHLKNVRREMQELKQKSLQTLGKQQYFLDHIDKLQKELIIFREESIRISTKNIEQAQQIDSLTLFLKESKKQKCKLQATIASLTRKNKEAAVTMSQMQSKLYQQRGQHKSNYQTFKETTTISHPPRYEINQERPFTTSLHFKNKNIQVRAHSFKKQSIQSNNAKLNVNNLEQSQKKIKQESKIVHSQERKSEIQSQSYQNRRERFSLRARRQRNLNNSLLLRQGKMIQSKQFATRNQYERVFRQCVQQVKRQIIRKTDSTTLNYFKHNSPLDLVTFKQLDYYHLLQLFLKNQLVITTFYQLIFPNSTSTAHRFQDK